jgi:hypothetical protein
MTFRTQSTTKRYLVLLALGTVAGSLAPLVPLSASAQQAPTVTLAGPAGDPLAGSTFDLTGAVTPSVSGRVVRLQRRSNGAFHAVGTQTLSSSGTFDFSRVMDTAGYSTYRVKALPAGSTGADYSPSVHVFVTTGFIRHSVRRAQSWVDAAVPYSSTTYYTNEYGTYRQDCSGFVSMAWHLHPAVGSAGIPDVTFAITKPELRRGDGLLHLASPGISGHVVMFDSWANAAHTAYLGYEETPSVGATLRTIPYPYWSGYGDYTAVRRDGT